MDGLAQDWGNSTADALEVPQSFTMSSRWPHQKVNLLHVFQTACCDILIEVYGWLIWLIWKNFRSLISVKVSLKWEIAGYEQCIN